MPLLEVDDSKTSKDHSCNSQAMLLGTREEFYARNAQSLCASLWPAKTCVKEVAEGHITILCKADNTSLHGLTSNAVECR